MVFKQHPTKEKSRREERKKNKKPKRRRTKKEGRRERARMRMRMRNRFVESGIDELRWLTSQVWPDWKKFKLLSLDRIQVKSTSESVWPEIDSKKKTPKNHLHFHFNLTSTSFTQSTHNGERTNEGDHDRGSECFNLVSLSHILDLIQSDSLKPKTFFFTFFSSYSPSSNSRASKTWSINTSSLIDSSPELSTLPIPSKAYYALSMSS